MQNFIQIGLRVSVLRMRDFASLVTWLLFWVFEKSYSQEARTDFNTKHVKRRGSAQESAFLGSRNQKLRFRFLIFPETAIFGPHFDGT